MHKLSLYFFFGFVNLLYTFYSMRALRNDSCRQLLELKSFYSESLKNLKTEILADERLCKIEHIPEEVISASESWWPIFGVYFLVAFVGIGGLILVGNLDQRTTANTINVDHTFAELTRIFGVNHDLNVHILQSILNLEKFISNSVDNGLILDDLTLEFYRSFKEFIDKRSD